MENRRQSYRHAFEPQDVLRAEITRPGQRGAVHCDLRDLSLGGVRLRLGDPGNPLKVGDSLVLRLFGREGEAPLAPPLTLRSQVVYAKREGEEWDCGIRFLPSADPRANERTERTLSNLLLTEQRRKRRKEES